MKGALEKKAMAFSHVLFVARLSGNKPLLASFLLTLAKHTLWASWFRLVRRSINPSAGVETRVD